VTRPRLSFLLTPIAVAALALTAGCASTPADDASESAASGVSTTIPAETLSCQNSDYTVRVAITSEGGKPTRVRGLFDGSTGVACKTPLLSIYAGKFDARITGVRRIDDRTVRLELDGVAAKFGLTTWTFSPEEFAKCATAESATAAGVRAEREVAFTFDAIELRTDGVDGAAVGKATLLGGKALGDTTIPLELLAEQTSTCAGKPGEDLAALVAALLSSAAP